MNKNQTLLYIGKNISRILMYPFAMLQAVLDDSFVLKRAGFNYREIYWGHRLKYLGQHVMMYSNVVIHFPSFVSIGSYSSLAEFTLIWGRGGVTIGENVLISSHVVIASQTHDLHETIMRNSQVDLPVIIEDNVWIGANAIILPGVKLGKGSVIGAGAVVTKDVEPNTIVVGIPAKTISNRITQ
jgi:maltose O-acetyltransferase